jgi:hypothetical protein
MNLVCLIMYEILRTSVFFFLNIISYKNLYWLITWHEL